MSDLSHGRLDLLRVDDVISVGQVITIGWSNGAGVTQYRVVDNPDNGPHLFEKIADFEWADNQLVKVD